MTAIHRVGSSVLCCFWLLRPHSENDDNHHHRNDTNNHDHNHNNDDTNNHDKFQNRLREGKWLRREGRAAGSPPNTSQVSLQSCVKSRPRKTNEVHHCI